jgi:PTH1 family peptidyl-tRNA hydrolase
MAAPGNARACGWRSRRPGRSVLDRIRGLLSKAGNDEEPREYRVRLIVGLGNPGGEYAGNRHNVGYWAVNRLARRHDIELGISGKAALGQGTIDGHEVALAKPRAYVNQSGSVVWNLIKRLKLDDGRELLVVYDELDLPVGRVRMRAKGGSGGYRGMKSIIDAVGTDDFPRIRIGIGRPVVQGKPSWDPEDVSTYVLSDPPLAERDLLDAAVERAMDAIELAVTEGVERAMAFANA